MKRLSITVAATGVLVLILTLVLEPSRFYVSYLLGFCVWWTIVPGSVALALLHDLTGGRWGRVLRPVLSSSGRVIPLLGLLFVPVLFGLDELYPWTRPDTPPLGKEAYLNVPFFVGRAVSYFLIWTGLALWVSSRVSSSSPAGRVGSGVGLILYVLSVTFASVDWLMSLSPEWFSSGFGLRIVASQLAGAVAFSLVILARRYPDTEETDAQDIGNLLLAFVMIWAYLAFSEYLIIWSGNLPEETLWYRERLNGGWRWLGLLLIVLHFAVPFLALLARGVKRRLQSLGAVALGLLIMRFFDAVWIVVPSVEPTLPLHWADLAAPAAIGGALLWLFSRGLERTPACEEA